MTEPQAEAKPVDIRPILYNYESWGSPESLKALTGFDSVDNPPMQGFDANKQLDIEDVVVAHLVSDPAFISAFLEMGSGTIPWLILDRMQHCLTKVIRNGGWLVTRPSVIVALTLLGRISRTCTGHESVAKKWKNIVPKHWFEEITSTVPDMYNLGVRAAACTFPNDGTSARALVLYANGRIGFAPNNSPALVISHYSEEEIDSLRSAVEHFVNSGHALLECVETLFTTMDTMAPIRAMPALTMQEEFIHYVANYSVGAVALQTAVRKISVGEFSSPLTGNNPLVGRANGVIAKLNEYRAKRVELTKLVNPPPAETQPAPEGAS